jgi:hypothetical protein
MPLYWTYEIFVSWFQINEGSYSTVILSFKFFKYPIKVSSCCFLIEFIYRELQKVSKILHIIIALGNQ